ncbi:type III secretion system chaperone [Ramlibacter sp.]|uniref:type III secretion system chaperone n=1 Tax=Ramlibacter sp. TaxID=1917967 RepID=UPI003D0B9AAB
MPLQTAIDDLVREAALMLSAEALVSDDERPAWTLRLADGLPFDIEHDDAQGRMVIVCPVGEAAPAARERLYERLLQYNFLWHDTGGLRMALSGTPGRVVLMLELPLPGLAPARLCAVLANMGEIRQSWHDILEAAAAVS